MSPFLSHRSRSRRERARGNKGVQIPNDSGELSGPALLEACLIGRIGFVESLLKLGASVHVRTDEGDTPLMLAAVQGSCAVVRRLLDAGSDIDAVNEHGLTALMEAAFWGNTEVVQLLLERGADTSVTDRQGRNALDWAILENRHDIIELVLASPRPCECDGNHQLKPTHPVSDDAENNPALEPDITNLIRSIIPPGNTEGTKAN